ncbi:MAG: tetratricopeptide repeat protein [Chloroflexota bacterium]
MRPGAVKQARAESGLSLADVAAGRVTRAAIHLIETGRSRPSMPVLEMIAERTGRPVSWFLAPGGRKSAADLELEARIGELEHMAVEQRYEEVRARAGELLEQAVGETFEARIRYFLGRALVRLNDPNEALPHLKRARAIFEALEDSWMVVECMDWIAGGMYVREDSGALEMQEEALRLCRSLDPVPLSTEIRLMTNLAAVYTDRQDWSRAVKLYEQVIAKGKDAQDMGRLARIYSGMGTAYRNLGDMTRAVSYTQKAAAFQSLQHDTAALARVELELAKLLIRHGDLAAAEEHLNRALKSCIDHGLEDQKGRVLLGMSELHLTGGDLERAGREANEAVREAQKAGRGATAADGHAALGRIRAASGDGPGADREFDAALRIYEGMNVPEKLVEIHHLYSEILRDRGDLDSALDHKDAALAITRPGLVAPAAKPAAARDSSPA